MIGEKIMMQISLKPGARAIRGSDIPVAIKTPGPGGYRNVATPYGGP